MKIGIFDSGIGGLSVLHVAKKVCPSAEYIYYADQEHVPYGEKTREEVISFTDGIIQFLIDLGVCAVVIACNTATSAAVEQMRKKYSIPIIGMEPAVKKALDTYGNKKVLVAATPITVKGQKMRDLLLRVDSKHLVDLIALPRLVEFAEREEFDSPDVARYIESEFSRFDLSEYSSLVLGCTHFGYFKSAFSRIIPKDMHFVDGCEGTVNRLFSLVTPPAGDIPVPTEYYYSGKRVSGSELDRINRYLAHLSKADSSDAT